MRAAMALCALCCLGGDALVSARHQHQQQLHGNSMKVSMIPLERQQLRHHQHHKLPCLCTAGIWKLRGGQTGMDSAELVLLSTARSGVAQLLLMLTILAFYGQIRIRTLTASGAVIPSALMRGEWHRLATSLFLNSDPLELAATCIFGHARLVPTAAAIFGPVQCALIFLAAGAGGQYAAWTVRRLPGAPPSLASSGAAQMGAAASLLGIDAALFSYCLCNTPRVGWLRALRTDADRAVRRTAMTLTALSLPACVRRWRVAMEGSQGVGGPIGWGQIMGAGGGLACDPLSLLFGYVVGLLLGLALAPSLPAAAVNLQNKILSDMSDKVSIECGASSAAAEAAMVRYLRRLPKAERAAALKEWALPPSPSLIASSEDWAAVFEALKAFVADSLRSVGASEGGGARQQQQQQQRRRRRKEDDDDNDEEEDEEEMKKEEEKARAAEELRQARLKAKAGVAVRGRPPLLIL